jgi:hypothetical protein
MHPFRDREDLAESSPKLENDPARPQSSTVDYRAYLPGDNRQPLYIGRLAELQPGASADWNRPFWEGKSIIHIDEDEPWQPQGILNRGDLNETHDFSLLSPLVIFIALLLKGMYGGVHIVAWRWSFPSYPEEIMWKSSCFLIMFKVPTILLFFLLVGLLEKMQEYMTAWTISNSTSWDGYGLLDIFYVTIVFILALAYYFARVFIIVESFISLRRASVGVFVSPGWVELFPHF